MSEREDEWGWISAVQPRLCHVQHYCWPLHRHLGKRRKAMRLANKRYWAQYGIVSTRRQTGLLLAILEGMEKQPMGEPFDWWEIR